MKITIKQIAEEAGVSMTTVSNVINKKEKRVSQEKIDLIENIIKKYNYIPNMNARSLVKSSSNLIGLLYFSPENDFSFADPFVSQILASVEREAKTRGYFIFVHNITSADDIKSIQGNWKFEGFIVVGVTSKDFSEINGALQSPAVYIDTHLSLKDKQKAATQKECLFVNSDDYQAGKIAAEYIVKNNHKKIAFLSYRFNTEYVSVIEQRYKAYLDVLTENEIAFNPQLVFVDSEFDKIKKKINEFTAIVVSGDYLAAKLIKYLKKNEMYENGKPSIISFDNNLFSDLIDPPLTTIHLNPELKGKLAFNNLLKMVNEEPIERTFTYLDGKLIVRKSVSAFAK